MAKKVTEYGNESIEVLEGPDRVRKRPAVIFGSNDIDGCEFLKSYPTLLTKPVRVTAIRLSLHAIPICLSR